MIQRKQAVILTAEENVGYSESLRSMKQVLSKKNKV